MKVNSAPGWRFLQMSNWASQAQAQWKKTEANSSCGINSIILPCIPFFTCGLCENMNRQVSNIFFSWACLSRCPRLWTLYPRSSHTTDLTFCLSVSVKHTDGPDWRAFSDASSFGRFFWADGKHNRCLPNTTPLSRAFLSFVTFQRHLERLRRSKGLLQSWRKELWLRALSSCYSNLDFRLCQFLLCFHHLQAQRQLSGFTALSASSCAFWDHLDSATKPFMAQTLTWWQTGLWQWTSSASVYLLPLKFSAISWDRDRLVWLLCSWCLGEKNHVFLLSLKIFIYIYSYLSTFLDTLPIIKLFFGMLIFMEIPCLHFKNKLSSSLIPLDTSSILSRHMEEAWREICSPLHCSAWTCSLSCILLKLLAFWQLWGCVGQFGDGDLARGRQFWGSQHPAKTLLFRLRAAMTLIVTTTKTRLFIRLAFAATAQSCFGILGVLLPDSVDTCPMCAGNLKW